MNMIMVLQTTNEYHCNDNHTNSSVWYLCLFGLLCYILDFDNVYMFFWRKVMQTCDFTSTGSKICTALHQTDIITVLRIFWYQANEWWMASNKQLGSFWNARYSSRILCLQISNHYCLVFMLVDWSLLNLELPVCCHWIHSGMDFWCKCSFLLIASPRRLDSFTNASGYMNMNRGLSICMWDVVGWCNMIILHVPARCVRRLACELRICVVFSPSLVWRCIFGPFILARFGGI